ncbi:transporter substrate-binding domain-containing protein [Pseudochelatococcus sp. B33]
MKMIYTIAVALAAYVSPSIALACTPAISDSDLISPGKVQLSINPTNPPAQFVDKDGRLQGLNVELAAALSEKLCLDIELVRMDFPAMIPAVTAGRLDGMNTGMFWTEERSKILYMVPYGTVAVGIFVPPNSTFAPASVEDLAGKSVGGELNGAQTNWLMARDKEQVAKGLPAMNIRTFTTATNVVAATLAGQVDAGAVTDFTARIMESEGRVKVVLNDLGPTPMAMAFGKRAVADAFVKALNEVREDGSYDELFKKFKMTPLQADQVIAIRGPGPK